MQVRAIRQAMRSALEGEGYRVYDVLPESGQLPLAAVQWPDSIEFGQTLGGTSSLTITVTVAVAASDFARAQGEIDDLMSTPGLGERIEAHPTTAWRAIRCASASNVQRMTIGNAEALAADFTFTVIA